MKQINKSGIKVKTSFGSVWISKEDTPPEGCDLAIRGQDGKYIILSFDWEKNNGAN